MLISVQFMDDFPGIPKGSSTTIDIDWTEPVENLKVLITVKYSALNIEHLNLYYHGRLLRNHQKINALNYNEGEVIFIRKVSSGLCVLI